MTTKKMPLMPNNAIPVDKRNEHITVATPVIDDMITLIMIAICDAMSNTIDVMFFLLLLVNYFLINCIYMWFISFVMASCIDMFRSPTERAMAINNIEQPIPKEAKLIDIRSESSFVSCLKLKMIPPIPSRLTPIDRRITHIIVIVPVVNAITMLVMPKM